MSVDEFTIWFQFISNAIVSILDYIVYASFLFARKSSLWHIDISVVYKKNKISSSYR